MIAVSPKEFSRTSYASGEVAVKHHIRPELEDVLCFAMADRSTFCRLCQVQ